jgi:predicted aminopeptidase
VHVTRGLLICLLALTLSGCALGYGMQAARGQWQLSRASEPIDKVLANPETAESLRAQLRHIQEARAFAVRELGLPDNASYTRYADVRRPFLVWSVVATPEFSLTPLRSCFPIAGCVSYRGYYSEAGAQRQAARLRRRGLDVSIGGVPAYSTLGYFADPVPNTLLRFGVDTAIATVFHELAHQVVYVTDDSTFNESFAVTVEEAGIERWLQTRGDSAGQQRLAKRRALESDYDATFARYRQTLATLYSAEKDPATLRRRKARIFHELSGALTALAAGAPRASAYADWIRAGLNNAHLASLATYQDCIPGFKRLLADKAGDLTAFYAGVRSLARLPPAERRRLLQCDGSTSAQATYDAAPS